MSTLTHIVLVTYMCVVTCFASYNITVIDSGAKNVSIDIPVNFTRGGGVELVTGKPVTGKDGQTHVVDVSRSQLVLNRWHHNMQLVSVDGHFQLQFIRINPDDCGLYAVFVSLDRENCKSPNLIFQILCSNDTKFNDTGDAWWSVKAPKSNILMLSRTQHPGKHPTPTADPNIVSLSLSDYRNFVIFAGIQVFGIVLISQFVWDMYCLRRDRNTLSGLSRYGRIRKRISRVFCNRYPVSEEFDELLLAEEENVIFSA